MVRLGIDDRTVMMIRPRRNWTADEDVILKREVRRVQAEGDNISWHDIAAFLPGRTNKDCRKRWYGTAGAKVKKGPWTEAEDARLRKAIERHGTKWAVVASVVGTRLPDQCSKRWSQAINPDIDHSPWTPQEDELLVQYVKKHGHYWQQIVSLYFPGRTSLAAKNRFHILQRRLKSEGVTGTCQLYDWGGSMDSSSWQRVLWPEPLDIGKSDQSLTSSTARSPLSDEQSLAPAGNAFATDQGHNPWLSLTPCSPFCTTRGEVSVDCSAQHLGDETADNGEFSFDSSFPSTITIDDLLLQTLSSTDSISTTIPSYSPPSLTDPRSTADSTLDPDHRRVRIQAVCSSEKLSAILDAVTKHSISAVIKTDD
ncbi:hypothetical protein BDW75DRAFT_242217 [Aspergillus navahoensis]